MNEKWMRVVEEYRGCWVALADDHATVLGSGRTLVDALVASVARGNDDPILLRVPDQAMDFAGYAVPL